MLDETLRLLHPVVPFVTEVLHERLGAALSESRLGDSAAPPAPLLARAQFPSADGERDLGLEERFEALQRLVTSVRRLRADAGLPPDQPLPVRVRETPDGFAALLRDTTGPVQALGRMDPLTVATPEEAGSAAANTTPGWVSLVESGFEISVELGSAADPATLSARIEKQRRRSAADAAKLAKRLTSPGFVERADTAVVEETRDRLAALRAREERLATLAAEMAGAPAPNDPTR